ncbi:hypothetical protein HNO84_16255 [Herbaspirillum robiniae]|uniref:Uncharacterized protein n=2 Tax=Herbaspirillum robiniae TaxID=2014887 RepID=A0ABX2M5P3_9BURK|nr:hypothetical protein [Herbaspirillum robiniae]
MQISGESGSVFDATQQSLDMSLEIEGEKPDWEALGNAIQSVGVVNYEIERDSVFQGAFAKSDGYFWLSKRSDGQRKTVIAEGNHGCEFSVWNTIVFRINNSFYDEFVEDIHIFLKRLAELSSMQFVLSFQYEGVYAIRNEKEFQFFWDQPR